MSFNCPTCKDGELTVDTRNLALEDGEIVQILEDGTPVISKIVCSNDKCENAATAEEDAGGETVEPDAAGETSERAPKICGKNGCPKPAGHMYRCKTKVTEE